MTRIPQVSNGIIIARDCPSCRSKSPQNSGESNKDEKIFSFSLIERVILSAGAMLIFSVSFQIDQMPEGEK